MTPRKENLFCHRCELQFRTKSIHQLHLKLIHKKCEGKDLLSCKRKRVENTDDVPIPKNRKQMPIIVVEKIDQLKSSVHEGKNKSKSKMCGASFIEKGSIKNHIELIHEGNKTVKCDICGAFLSKQQMNNHIVTAHEKNKQFKCEICNGNFTQKTLLKKHIDCVHTNATFVMQHLSKRII